MKKEPIKSLMARNGITYAEQVYTGEWLVSFNVYGYGRVIPKRMSGKTLREAIEKVRQFKQMWDRKSLTPTPQYEQDNQNNKE